MKPSIPNMWQAVEGISQRTSSTLWTAHADQVIAALIDADVINSEQATIITGFSGRLKDAFETYVTLAICCDCLTRITVPLIYYVNANRALDALNLSPLLPILRPLAHYYSLTRKVSYSPFARLSEQHVPAFIGTFIADGDAFGARCNQTLCVGMKLVTCSAILLGNDRLMNRYFDDVLDVLLQETVALTGTARDLTSLTCFQPQLDYCRAVYSQKVRTIARPSSNPSAGRTSRLDAPANSDDSGSREQPELLLKEAVDELDSLIGLPSVKDELGRLKAFLAIQKERRKHGLRESSQTLHFVFTGNPGTGKTTVARIVGKILFGFGFLKTSKVIETDRSSLVGGYLGQTAIKTDEVIRSALDGVLFIDEAYTLSDSADHDSYGSEAISTLLKRMEDSRDRLSVIVAGYPDLMDNFLRMNPGLSSRFTRHIRFDDYGVADLGQIFLRFCRESQYAVSSKCLGLLSFLFGCAYKARDERFGNARYVRNIFEEVTVRNSQRLVSLGKAVDKAKLMQLEPSDVVVGPLAGLDAGAVRFEQLKWRCRCPNCKAAHSGTFKHLGRRINCVKCGKPFNFEYWEPILETLAIG